MIVCTNVLVYTNLLVLLKELKTTSFRVMIVTPKQADNISNGQHSYFDTASNSCCSVYFRAVRSKISPKLKFRFPLQSSDM